MNIPKNLGYFQCFPVAYNAAIKNFSVLKTCLKSSVKVQIKELMGIQKGEQIDMSSRSPYLFTALSAGALWQVISALFLIPSLLLAGSGGFLLVITLIFSFPVTVIAPIGIKMLLVMLVSKHYDSWNSGWYKFFCFLSLFNIAYGSYDIIKTLFSMFTGSFVAYIITLPLSVVSLLLTATTLGALVMPLKGSE